MLMVGFKMATVVMENLKSLTTFFMLEHEIFFFIIIEWDEDLYSFYNSCGSSKNSSSRRG